MKYLNNYVKVKVKQALNFITLTNFWNIDETNVVHVITVGSIKEFRLVKWE